METIFSMFSIPTHTPFLPYLWGMETAERQSNRSGQDGSYRTYEEWKQLKCCQVFLRTSSSYRTYEEWKLGRHSIVTCLNECSYRTYEEWKPSFSDCFDFFNGFLPYLWGMETDLTTKHWACPLRSYRTYEEWKRVIRKKRFAEGLWVLTVPMRNGNSPQQIILLSKARFLPYLWGMETS